MECLNVVIFLSRTDLSTYNIYQNGILDKSVVDLKSFKWNDIVSFYIGCSFSFDGCLINNGVDIKTDNNDVGMYLTNIDCVSVGPFSTKMIVSMRNIHVSQLKTAVECTIDCDFAHGAPMQIGSPEDIGIKDITRCDFGSPNKIELLEDEIPVFWACGMTSSEAAKSASKKGHTPTFRAFLIFVILNVIINK